MISLPFISELFAAGVLFYAIVAIGKPRLPALIRHYAISSLCLAGLTLATSFLERDAHMLIAATGTIVFKVLLIPWILRTTADRHSTSLAVKFYARPALTYFIVVAMLAIAFVITQRVPIETLVHLSDYALLFDRSLLFICIALVLIGLSMMIMRRDLFSQIIGFLIMENGIAAFAIVTVGGVPLLIEMGVFFVVAMSTILMSMLSRHVLAIHTSGDTELLRELTD